MILFPTTHLSDAERRAGRILQHGVECGDKQLLSELWCVLRNAEAAQESDSTRKRLYRLREEVGDAIADVESESTRDGPAGAKPRLRTNAPSARRRAELERARQRKSRDY